MTEFTPDTQNIENCYVYACTDEYSGTTPRLARAEFQRWLDDVKAKAWDEGHNAARQSARGYPQMPFSINPYKDN